MNAGRPAKPISQHEQDGTFRKDRHVGAVLPVEAPPMPGHLKGYAEAAWHVLVENLRFAGLVSRVDGQALQLLCESIALYIEAMDEIEREGVLLKESTQFGTRHKENPACGTRGRAWKEIVTLLHKFGLTPGSRTSVRPGKVGEGSPESDRVTDILFGSTN